MKTTLVTHLVTVAALLASAGACSSPEERTEDAGTPALDSGEVFTSDASFARDVGSERPDAAGFADGGADASLAPPAFTLHAPEERTVTCDNGDVAAFTDVDYVCRLEHRFLNGYVYVRATATDCYSSRWPIYTSEVQVSENGVASFADGYYDYIPNHHHQYIHVEWQGHCLELWTVASTLEGPCLPFDCAVVVSCTTPPQWLENGCGSDRSIPASCQLVKADGTLGAFPEGPSVCN
ncbi:MAG: hypothetical protein HY901_15885 [Deltaproteobacteria bacterium]|nr:hypothetical protein [Deltaproteobacteria bacterium]